MRLCWHRKRTTVAIVSTASLLLTIFYYFPWTTYNHVVFVSTLTGGHRRLAGADDHQVDYSISRGDRQLTSKLLRNSSRIDKVLMPRDDKKVLLSPHRHMETGNLKQAIENRMNASRNIRTPDVANTRRKDVNTGASRNDAGNNGKCRPHHDVVFWKTHKCGSSTMQNIMFRYAVKNDLRLLLPPQTHLFDLLRRFNASKVPRQFVERGKHFNIFTHHARFSAADVATVMPSDSIYVTILRSPLTLYESIYTYLNLKEFFGNETNPVKFTQFLKNPRKYYDPSVMKVHPRYGRNPLLYDLGLDPVDMDSKMMIADTILEVQLRFHFVMIAEYFDESLILLKQLLCWDFSDISYLKLNARAKSRTPSPFAEKLLKEWNYGDMQLYQYFNDTFWKRVDAYGRARMERDVRTLRELNARLIDRCVEEEANPDKIADQESHWHPDGVNIVGYRLKISAVNDPICRDVIKSEKLFTDEIRAKQGDYVFEAMDGREYMKWWHIKNEEERKAAKVLDAMLEWDPQDNPPGG